MEREDGTTHTTTTKKWMEKNIFIDKKKIIGLRISKLWLNLTLKKEDEKSTWIDNKYLFYCLKMLFHKKHTKHTTDNTQHEQKMLECQIRREKLIDTHTHACTYSLLTVVDLFVYLPLFFALFCFFFRFVNCVWLERKIKTNFERLNYLNHSLKQSGTILTYILILIWDVCVFV